MSEVEISISPKSVELIFTHRDGDDGPWSSFKATVGTPPQNVRLYPASSQSSLWVILPEGCAATGSPDDCAHTRGFVFQKNESSTWSEKGLFELTTVEENSLGLTGNGDWGYDTITLAWQGDPSSPFNGLVTGIATPSFYLGAMGINNQPVNFTTFNDPQPSLLKTLKNLGKIPSLSWGYTAGAFYQQPFGFGSLTLGGYDTTRFTANTLTIPFGPDSSRDLLIAIQSIRSTNTQTQLLPVPQFFWIDSTVSQLWLPVEACIAFEQAFGIVLDKVTGLYLVNDSLNQRLLKQNPNVTFTIGSELSGGTTVDIVFPYAAFNLNATLPLINGSSFYFPLKQVTNESQYTLGRTFLQEAYLTVDYERSTFQVQQAVFPDQSIAQKLVAVQPENHTVNDTNMANGNGASKPGVGLEAGAIIGSLVAVGLISIAALLCIRQRRKKRNLMGVSADSLPLPQSDKVQSGSSSIGALGEVDLRGTTELPASIHQLRYELGGVDTQRNELPCKDARHSEMTGNPISSEFQTSASELHTSANRSNERLDFDRVLAVHELQAHC